MLSRGGRLFIQAAEMPMTMGYRVFARMLKKIPSLEQRRNLYFAANAKFCSRPSLQEKFPDKAQVQKEFSLEPHSAGKKRRTEVLIAPIRSVLGCGKDVLARAIRLLPASLWASPHSRLDHFD